MARITYYISILMMYVTRFVDGARQSEVANNLKNKMLIDDHVNT